METDRLTKLTDLYLVSYLDLKGFPIIKRGLEGRYTVFFYEPSEALDKEIDNFLNKRGLIDALSYAERYRTLRKVTIDARRY